MQTTPDRIYENTKQEMLLWSHVALETRVQTWFKNTLAIGSV